MIRVHHALDRVIALYPPGLLEYSAYKTVSQEDSFWIVQIHNTQIPDSLLQVEVFDDDGIPKCCVTGRVNIGRKTMFRFMDQFVDALEASRLSEPMS